MGEVFLYEPITFPKIGLELLSLSQNAVRSRRHDGRDKVLCVSKCMQRDLFTSCEKLLIE